MSVQDRRARVPVVIVDDRAFPYERRLRKHDFNITKLNDISNIKTLNEYGVILCDIKGVGSELSKQYEGAHIIKEIKKRYPEKIIIAYTAHQFDASYNEFFSMADIMTKKDQDFDTWIDQVDKAIEKRLDPVEQWYRVRNYLLEDNVSMYTALKIEQGYIDAIENRNQKKLIKRAENSSLSSETKSVIIGASELIFSIIS